jgi:hypothetical protein
VEEAIDDLLTSLRRDALGDFLAAMTSAQR